MLLSQFKTLISYVKENVDSLINETNIFRIGENEYVIVVSEKLEVTIYFFSDIVVIRTRYNHSFLPGYEFNEHSEDFGEDWYFYGQYTTNALLGAYSVLQLEKKKNN